MSFYLAVVNLEQYVENVPDPLVKLDNCNSTNHYNGYLDQSVICTGSRSEKLPCRVRLSLTFYWG